MGEWGTTKEDVADLSAHPCSVWISKPSAWGYRNFSTAIAHYSVFASFCVLFFKGIRALACVADASASHWACH
jgi:hypothetical protein